MQGLFISVCACQHRHSLHRHFFLPSFEIRKTKASLSTYWTSVASQKPQHPKRKERMNIKQANSHRDQVLKMFFLPIQSSIVRSTVFGNQSLALARRHYTDSFSLHEPHVPAKSFQAKTQICIALNIICSSRILHIFSQFT